MLTLPEHDTHLSDCNLITCPSNTVIEFTEFLLSRSFISSQTTHTIVSTLARFGKVLY